MCHKIDMTGMVFGRWTVLRRTGSDKRGELLWLCRCSCGNESSLTGSSLRSGNSVSCGCYQKDHPSQRKHGASRTRLYGAWKAMIRRCENANTGAYKDYGARGIRVCERWRHSFENFLSDMGPRPKGHSIERKNNDGNYEPSNCHWAPSKDQANNTRANRVLSIHGETKTLTQWSEKSGVRVGTIWKRLSVGWNEERAVFDPVKIEEV